MLQVKISRDPPSPFNKSDVNVFANVFDKFGEIQVENLSYSVNRDKWHDNKTELIWGRPSNGTFLGGPGARIQDSGTGIKNVSLSWYPNGSNPIAIMELFTGDKVYVVTTGLNGMECIIQPFRLLSLNLNLYMVLYIVATTYPFDEYRVNLTFAIPFKGIGKLESEYRIDPLNASWSPVVKTGNKTMFNVNMDSANTKFFNAFPHATEIL